MVSCLECMIFPSCELCAVHPLKPDQNHLLQGAVLSKLYSAITTHPPIRLFIHAFIQSFLSTSYVLSALSLLYIHEH